MLLSSSSFFYQNYLQYSIKTQTLTLHDIQHTRKNGYFIQLMSLFNAIPEHNQQWIRYAYMLAPYQGEVAYQLAQHFNPINSSKNVTTLVLEKRQQQYQYWLTTSVNLNYVQAVSPLVNALMKQNNYEQVQELLASYYHHSELLKTAFILALEQGDKQKLKLLKPLLTNDKTLMSFTQKMHQYLRTDDIDENKLINELCHHTRIIQPYATNLDDLVKTEALISQLNNDPLAQHFCFLPVRYVPLPDLQCSHENNEVIQCDESRWPEFMTNQVASHSIIVLPNGGANVHGNTMYLDRFDNVAVLVHELSHFLGFVDEYPLIKNHVFCQYDANHKALNVSLIPKYWLGKRADIRKKVLKLLPWRNYITINTPILSRVSLTTNNHQHVSEVKISLLSQLTSKTKQDSKEILWQIGTPINNAKVNNEPEAIGVYPALTCHNTQVVNPDTGDVLQSVKPLYKRTTLQYFEVEFPALYLQLIDQHL